MRPSYADIPLLPRTDEARALILAALRLIDACENPCGRLYGRDVSKYSDEYLALKRAAREATK